MADTSFTANAVKVLGPYKPWPTENGRHFDGISECPSTAIRRVQWSWQI